MIFTACLIAVSCAFPEAAAYDGECSAKAAVVYQPDTGELLYERCPDEKSLIASTTKILTALVVLESCRVDDMVPIKPEYTGVEGSSMYLKAGERFTVKELLYGLMLVSGNDAAHALAVFAAGSDEAFAELMNAKADELGCTGSHFANPHGLDDENHYSTARDLAKIMAAAMDNPDFAEITGTKSVALAGRTMVNHNKLLWSCAGVMGGKTGYTQSAGRTLVSCCERDGMRLICVTISDRDDWADHAALYDWAYGEYCLLKGGGSYEIPVISGERETAYASAENRAVLARKNDGWRLETQLPRFVYAPVNEGQTAGQAVYKSDSGDTVSFTIRYDDTVPLDKSVPLTIWEQIKWSWYYYNAHSSYVPRLYIS